MEGLKIVATIVAKKGYEAEITKTLHMLADGSRAEQGNVSYAINRQVDDALTFVVLEHWKSQDAINFHNDTPHFTRFKQEIEGKVSSVTISVLEQIY